jgi:dTDP-4-amino-4,6-dideoxygalactose transaminase
MKRIQISKPDITEAEKMAVMEVLDSGMLAQGPRTAAFEERFADQLGVKHAIAVSNGTCALQLALLANGIGTGDEVLTTPFTFMATINAILFAGARPIFVDIDEDSFNLNADLIEAAITPRTKAILPVHLYGQTCDMQTILAVAEEHGLKVIEDACQAVLATYDGRFAGSFGTGAFSFYATKNLMTGEGGMVTTNDDIIAQRCRMIRNHGMQQRYYHEVVGYNFRLTDLQSAIGLAQLERLERLTAKRWENAAYLNAHIESVVTPKTLERRGHVWHQYTVRVANGIGRDAAVKQLSEAGIDTGIYYPVPVHQQRSISGFIGEVHMPVAEQMATQVMSLPVHPSLSREDLEIIVEEVNKL